MRMNVKNLPLSLAPQLDCAGGSVVKKSSCNAGNSTGDVGLILGWEAPLEKCMATCFSILAWRIPWTEEPDGL